MKDEYNLHREFDERLNDLSHSLLGMWSRLEHHECHYRRAFGELLSRCSYALMVMQNFENRIVDRDGQMTNVERMRSVIMQCITPADILRVRLEEFEAKFEECEEE